jgi:Cu+-exporting ATPase
MVDPVCGMNVDPATAAAAWEHEGTTYYFCSVGCFDRFRAEPDAILRADPSTRSM